jgi:hydroxypyruvate reductase
MTLAALEALRGCGDTTIAPEAESSHRQLPLRGTVVTKYGHVAGPERESLVAAGLTVTEAAHPVPDAAGTAAAASVLELVRDCSEADVVLLLLSGGGSALLSRPVDGLSLADLQAMNSAQLEAGCTIDEVNAVRKHTSSISGGRLAAASKGRLLTLVLSDVVGDKLEVIASGPSVPDPSTFSDCARIIARYPGLADALPAAVVAHVRAGAAGLVDETPKSLPASRQHVHIVGSNRAALQAAAGAVEAVFGARSLVLTSRLQGEAAEAAKALVAVAQCSDEWQFGGQPLCASAQAASFAGSAGRKSPATSAGVRSDGGASAPAAGATPRPRYAVLAGGETTVTLRRHASDPEPGRGGRNQELALAALIAAAGPTSGSSCGAASAPFSAGDVGILCFGTDGTDGPTDAAGVYIPSARLHWRTAEAAGLYPAAALQRHDAYTFFQALDGPMRTAFAASEAPGAAAFAGEPCLDAHSAAGAIKEPADEPRPIHIAPGGLIRTGGTGTNVCDVTLLLIY